MGWFSFPSPSQGLNLGKSHRAESGDMEDNVVLAPSGEHPQSGGLLALMKDSPCLGCSMLQQSDIPRPSI